MSISQSFHASIESCQAAIPPPTPLHSRGCCRTPPCFAAVAHPKRGSPSTPTGHLCFGNHRDCSSRSGHGAGRRPLALATPMGQEDKPCSLEAKHKAHLQVCIFSQHLSLNSTLSSPKSQRKRQCELELVTPRAWGLQQPLSTPGHLAASLQSCTLKKGRINAYSQQNIPFCRLEDQHLSLPTTCRGSPSTASTDGAPW